MKKLTLTLLLLLWLMGITWAQVPEKINYQAVARDGSGALLVNRLIGVQVSILDGSAGGSVLYSETHMKTTNDYGLFTLEVGGGTVTSGVFSAINWVAADRFLRIEMDPDGGSNYTNMGESQLLSVPYALHAGKAENITETDPVFTSSVASGIAGNDITHWNSAYGWGDHATAGYAPALHTHSAADITSGTFNIGRIPTGTTASTVSLGNHVHGNITSDGKIGTTANRMVATTTGGSLTTMNAGTTSQYLRGDGTWASPLPAGTVAGQMLYWSGTAWITVPAGESGQVLTFSNGVPKWVGSTVASGDVLNPATGKIWQNKNLGATQVATSSNDGAAYGDLYQWGRLTDGHQLRTSGTTTTLSTGNSTGHSNFIVTSSSPTDWRNPQNENLWQGSFSTNNPCPANYRLPTAAEWYAELASWSSNNATGAFNSPLKLPAAGQRMANTAAISNAGTSGFYWSSSVQGTFSQLLLFGSSSAYLYGYGRAYGNSVRCMKE